MITDSFKLKFQVMVSQTPKLQVVVKKTTDKTIK